MNFRNQIFIFLLFVCIAVTAQSDFKPGYIIKNSDDTIRGEIDYRGDLLMGNICRFKSPDNAIIEYSAYEIVGYRFVDSKYFISKDIDNKKMFLEFLINGIVNIYYLRDDKGEHYYIEKDGQKISELVYEEGIRYKDEVPHFYETKIHKGILQVYMQDAPDISDQIQSVKKPEHKNLIKLAEEYQKQVCSGEECIIYEKKEPLIGFAIEPVYGILMYTGNDINFDFYGTELYFGGTQKIFSLYGCYFLFNTKRSNERLSVKTGITYHSVADLDIFRVPFQLVYTYPAFRIKPKIGFGFKYNSLKSDNFTIDNHSLNLSTGLNYKIYRFVNLCLNLDSDYTPLFDVFTDSRKFSLNSYSLSIGLNMEF